MFIGAALAAHAAVAVENAQLYEEIERLLEGFVTAAVTAIESRDPTTSGHSLRVATFSTELATAGHGAWDGPYAETRFSKAQLRELRYAGLPHDFGKVGVRESVLGKQKKLYGQDLTLLRQRIDLLHAQVDLACECELRFLRIPKGNLDARHASRDRVACRAHLRVPPLDPLDA